MASILRVLGDPHKRPLKRYEAQVREINALEPEVQALSDADLRARTDEFRERLGVTGPDLSLGQPVTETLLTGEEGEDADLDAEEERRAREEAEREQIRLLDDLVPEAFATVREASRRTLGMRHYDVQLIGGLVLHQGKIAEMRTGEGKTLVATLALYLSLIHI